MQLNSRFAVSTKFLYFQSVFQFQSIGPLTQITILFCTVIINRRKQPSLLEKKNFLPSPPPHQSLRRRPLGFEYVTNEPQRPSAGRLPPDQYGRVPKHVIGRRSIERQSLCALVDQSISVVVLQRLVQLCSPMREWRSPLALHTAQMMMEEGKEELFLRRARLSSAALWWRLTSVFSIPSFQFTLRLQHDHSQYLPSSLDQFRML